MSDSQNDKGVGEQIKDAVQRALDSGDFRDVNRIVANTVNGALTEAGRQLKRAAEDAGKANSFGPDSGATGKGAYTGHPEWDGTGAGGSQTAGAGGRKANAGFGAFGGRPGADGQAGGAGHGQKSGQTGGAGYGQKSGQTGSAGYGQKSGQARRTDYGQNPGGYRNSDNQRRSYGGRRNAANTAYYTNTAYAQRAAVQKPPVTAAPWAVYSATGRLKKVGQTSGTLLIVFGSIGLSISTLVLVFQLLHFFAVLNLASSGLVPNLIIWGVFFLMIQTGCMKIERLKRVKRYLSLFGGKNYCNVEDLALQMSRSRRFVLRDIKRLLRKGFFPQGHLDEEETCLMLDDATYREYLQLQKEKKQREALEKAEKNYSAKPAPAPEEPEAPKQEEEQDALSILVAQGQDCIRKLRDMNDTIEGEGVSVKLFRLENVLKEIFGRVQEHPEQVSQLRKFMDYYLPTTLKLVQAYAEFDDVSAPGEHILSAKTEIEGTLDTINQAFEELLNKLFMDAAMDVTTDAQVLQTMLAQEGLTREKEFAPRSTPS